MRWDLVGDVSHPYLGVVSEAEQHLRMAGDKSPGRPRSPCIEFESVPTPDRAKSASQAPRKTSAHCPVCATPVKGSAHRASSPVTTPPRRGGAERSEAKHLLPGIFFQCRPLLASWETTPEENDSSQLQPPDRRPQRAQPRVRPRQTAMSSDETTELLRNARISAITRSRTTPTYG
jgi:hypothetical protein